MTMKVVFLYWKISYELNMFMFEKNDPLNLDGDWPGTFAYDIPSL